MVSLVWLWKVPILFMVMPEIQPSRVIKYKIMCLKNFLALDTLLQDLINLDIMNTQI